MYFMDLCCYTVAMEANGLLHVLFQMHTSLKLKCIK